MCSARSWLPSRRPARPREPVLPASPEAGEPVLELRPPATRYRLCTPAGQQHILDQMVRLVCSARGPLQVWHGPCASATGGSWPVPRTTLLCRLGGSPAAQPHDLLGPGAAPDWAPPDGEHPGHLDLVGGRLGRAVAVIRWPAAVPGDWTGRLAADPAVAALSLHLAPLDGPDAARLVRRLLGSLLARTAVAAEHGALPDAREQAAADSAAMLAGELARGRTSLVRAQLLVAVVADTEDELAAATSRLEARLSGVLAGARHCRWEQATAWAALAPGGPPLPGPWRVLDAAGAAASIPHPCRLPDLATSGLPLGHDLDTGELVCLDRFAAPNPARLVVGTSGAGKSFAAKLEVARWLSAGGRAVVVDPEGEFAAGLGAGRPALVVRLGGPGGGLDPVGTACSQRLSPAEAVGLLASVLAALLGQPLSAAELGQLDLALVGLRTEAGSPGPREATPGRAGPGRPVGSLDTLIEALRAGPGAGLGDRLEPAARGSLGALFAPHPSLADPPALVVLDTRDVPQPARPAVTAAVLAWAWTRLRDEQPSLLVLDEAHLLLADPAAAGLLAQFARRARKYGVALEVVTQQLSDFLTCPAGQAVLANTASALLLGCADTERAAVVEAFGLSEAEARVLVPGHPGRGLLLAAGCHLPVQVAAGADEYALAARGPRP